MVRPLAICPRHGLVPAPFEVGAGATFERCATNCPVPGCGQTADIVDGTYQLVGNVVRIVRGTNATRNELIRLREAAQKLQKGAISPEQAKARVPGPLAEALDHANTYSGGYQLLVAIIGVLLLLYFETGSNKDAEKLLKATERQTQVIQSAAEAEQRILEELARRAESAPTKEAPPAPSSPTQQADQAQTQGRDAPLSRQQKRRAQQLARKRDPQKP